MNLIDVRGFKRAKEGKGAIFNIECRMLLSLKFIGFKVHCVRYVDSRCLDRFNTLDFLLEKFKQMPGAFKTLNRVCYTTQNRLQIKIEI